MRTTTDTSALAFAFAAGLALAGEAIDIRPAAAQAQESPADIIASQLRRQGFACDAPVSAQRDPRLQSPDQAVWTLACKNATYRVRLTPDQAAKVETID